MRAEAIVAALQFADDQLDRFEILTAKRACTENHFSVHIGLEDIGGQGADRGKQIRNNATRHFFGRGVGFGNGASGGCDVRYGDTAHLGFLRCVDTSRNFKLRRYVRRVVNASKACS